MMQRPSEDWRAPLRRWAPSWGRFSRATLPTDWVFFFACTHFPGARLPDVPSSDKIVHFCVFGLLAFLFWKFFESFTRPLSGRFVWWTLPALAAYAAIDEYLQQFVHRGTDIEDWLANM